jgi:hypothetical protein
MQISGDKARNFETHRIAGLPILPDLKSSALHIFGNANNHPVGTAEKDGSHDPVEDGHRLAGAHSAQLCSANLDLATRKRRIRHRDFDPG